MRWIVAVLALAVIVSIFTWLVDPAVDALLQVLREAAR